MKVSKVSILFLGLVSTVLCISCIQQHPKIIVHNTSNLDYDSIHVSTFEGEITAFNDIKINDRLEGVISFKNTKKGDGGYSLKVYTNDSIIRQLHFGYYTNGSSLNSAFEVFIENDTIKVFEE
ncbi:hypothetical protein [Reichenbachiella sp. MALMAid0571]|uniref:hypothetical protein n=1 Tax=Reichenbachiella sp. MALMAid0571 TaxID=3143939 RepID=UPI0032DE4292